MSKPLNVPEVLQLVEDIYYKDWCLNIQVPDVGYLIWWGWDATDVNDPTQTIRCNSRKWLVEFNPTKEQFIKTAFMAAVQAEEHECRENFKVLTRGHQLIRPFDPHKEIL
jgi:hypothetical protein